MLQRVSHLAEAARSRTRAAARTIAVRYGGLPHSVGTVDSPPPPVAHDVTQLWLRNLTSRDPITDSTSDETVTMTTHGQRIRDVWLAIESIGRGDRLPSRIILWLDEGTKVPWRLRRLRSRGLEIQQVARGWGVHTKYWPYVSRVDPVGPLVTADDDILYPPNWLQDLHTLHERYPDDVIAFRAHSMVMVDHDNFAPYSSWPTCTSTEPSYAHFATSVSGQLLPTGLQNALREEGPGFIEICPTADDVWIHRCAVAHGFRTRQVEERSLHWWFIPGSQTSGLNAVNVVGGANDAQLRATHTELTRGRIWASAGRPQRT
ncbi:hypothetical protein [Microbacterium sp. Ru50]|uniref:hypothetical protein n=1 Tax=Microbacterium sp. Ru50 TaxID=2080744 RepID=UPI0011AEDCEB|nr:hypothetical protein [Microbacterium sp. Ru50]